MKKSVLFILIIFLSFQTFAKENNQEKQTLKIIASTSWTAAFADLAGLDSISVIAPVNLRHPPEYEITVSDIKKIMESDIFIYAGFERMMQTLGNSVGNTKMIKIDCDNSVETVLKSSQKIAEICGTQNERDKRVKKYLSFIEESSNILEKKNLKNAKIFVNKNQRFLAKEFGFDTTNLFGPGLVTASQIQTAKDGEFIFIIDNIHNPVGKPLAEVSPNSKYILWRNFPQKVEKDALLHVVQENFKNLEIFD